MKKFTGSIYQDIQIAKKNGARKPLITFTEFADEVGVTPGQLRYAFRCPNAPKPALKNNGGQTCTNQKNSWYRVDEIRSWWKNRENTQLHNKEPHVGD